MGQDGDAGQEGGSSAGRADSQTISPDRPLIPQELVSCSAVRSGSGYQLPTPDPLLRFFSRPGHLHGQGYQRVYIGNRPAKGHSSTVTVGEGRSFLIGIDALWAEEAIEQRYSSQAKPVDSSDPSSATGAAQSSSSSDIRTTRDPFDFSQHSSSSNIEGVDGGDDSGSDSSPSSGSDHSTQSKRRHFNIRKGKQRALYKSSRAHLRTPSTDGTSPDTLFQKLRSDAHRKHLSSGDSQECITNGFAIPDLDVTGEPRVETPEPIATPALSVYSSAIDSFHTARPDFFSHKSSNTSERSLAHSQASTSKPAPDSSRRPYGNTLTVPGEHSKSRLSLRTIRDTVKNNHRIPSPARTPEAGTSNVGPSTAAVMPAAAAKPSDSPPLHSTPRIAASIDHRKKDANVEITKLSPKSSPSNLVHSPPMLQRPNSSDTVTGLAALAAQKEASLPAGAAKLERMLVRLGYTKREDLPQEYDEVSERRFRMAYKPWEEMVVVRRHSSIELWACHPDPFRRYLSKKLRLKMTIPLRASSTSLSSFSDASHIFCMSYVPTPTDRDKLRHRIPGFRATTGTHLVLFRARSPSIAQDAYFDLHLALDKQRPDKLEVHFPALAVSTIVSAFDSEQSGPPANNGALSASASRKITEHMEKAGTHRQKLVPKQQVIENSVQLLTKRHDWADLVNSLEQRGLSLGMAWRRNNLLDWLSYHNSVDGIKRIWDMYVGAIMKQSSTLSHRLEVHIEVHYPTRIPVSASSHMVEPPALEGFIYRLRFRNESQKERLYLSTHDQFILLTKPGRAKPPQFPDFNRWDSGPDATPKAAMDAFIHMSTERNVQQMLHCQGGINMRSIETVELSRTCKNCQKKRAQDAAHDHQIIDVNLDNDLRFRFEVEPASAATEWVARLQALIKYWHRRRERDAADQLMLSDNIKVQPQSRNRTAADKLPPFQARELADLAAEESNYSPLLAQTFNFCSMYGCRLGALRFGRLFYKNGHKTDPFKDGFFQLAGNHLIQFESVRRDLQGHPVPLVYHRRLRNIRLRDIYIMTGNCCSQFLDTRDARGRVGPAAHEAPVSRIYGDGLISIDDPIQCTFVIWKQKASKSNVAGLGKDGKVYVFQARSRLERDQWVHSLNAVCERLVRSGREREVQLASFKSLG